MIVNRRVWIVDQLDGIPFTAGPFVVTSLKRFIPADPKHVGKMRTQSAIDFFTDSGRRVALVASIWMRDPNRNSTPF